MQDHLQAVISFPYERPMRQIIADSKRFLATKLEIDWQPDVFDHRLRKEESYREKADYIRANPVRAGLVTQLEEWPYFWTADPQESASSEDRALRGGAPGGRALPILLAFLVFLVGFRPDVTSAPKGTTVSVSEFI